MGNGIGDSVLRVEDLRFITGRGTYTDDLQRPGQVHAYLVRANMAHGVIRKVDVSAARAAPGVVAAFNGKTCKMTRLASCPAAG